ncbi:MAG: hypothetical protein ABIH88_00460 [Patescibacteria group bacterium]|nr:DUF1003 domain-containing protein [Patescibacteria group bacterium]
MKKDKSALGKITRAIAWFMGSWWSVIFHTIWFAVWLIFNFNLNILTLWVSLEAIFLGIFLLMSSNKSEQDRDRQEAALRAQDRKRVEHDIKLDEKADRQLLEIKKMQKKLAEDVEEIRETLKS